MFDVPVALMIYNRPELTRQVFAQIRLLRPRQLFIIADGPKDETDDRNCRQARQVVAEVDWDCNVQSLYSAHNLGVAKCPSNGLQWVFAQVDRCIILEDDTLPDISFFEFCRLLLQEYEDDESVMSISGANLCGVIQTEYSYGFSRFSLPPWGWATWRRAWHDYDFQMADWIELKSTIAGNFKDTFAFWEMILDRYSIKLTSWDVQWNYAIWKKNGQVIIPSRNMIRNLGYGAGASFTTVEQSFTTHLPVTPCSFPLAHPVEKKLDFNAYLEPKVIEFLEEIIRFNSQRDAVGL